MPKNIQNAWLVALVSIPLAVVAFFVSPGQAKLMLIVLLIGVALWAVVIIIAHDYDARR